MKIVVFSKINIVYGNKAFQISLKNIPILCYFLGFMAASVNIKQQNHRKNEMLINFRVMPLLEYAQMLKSIGDIFLEFSKKESDNQANRDFSRPYSGFCESSITVSSLQALLFLHIMDCRYRQRAFELRQISLWRSRTLQLSRYSYAH
jgi:hypothetical protein